MNRVILTGRRHLLQVDSCILDASPMEQSECSFDMLMQTGGPARTSLWSCIDRSGLPCGGSERRATELEIMACLASVMGSGAQWNRKLGLSDGLSGVSWHARDCSRHPAVLCGESRPARLSNTLIHRVRCAVPYRQPFSFPSSSTSRSLGAVEPRVSAVGHRYGLPYAPPQDRRGCVPPAVYPNGSIARPNLTAQEIRA